MLQLRHDSYCHSLHCRQRSLRHPVRQGRIRYGIFRRYAVVIAFFAVVADTEWGSITKFWKVLEYWAGRSMLQILVAVMTRALPDYSASQKDLILLQNIPSYLLLACGVVYVVSAR
ncbi:hypothetical protein P3X46_024723 [Hevea brasiliensis]|uniref:Uncharacterized protein n=1 Tax=Hevea brasiliensis TaxID=3981 RepID=A0ABQ9L4W8_HEVBR|nr:hypothetical protein P3X46_024723 [Hevea brasiliensis]